MAKDIGMDTAGGDVGEVADRHMTVAAKRPWIESARPLGVCLGGSA